jgi:subtilisin-like proprotein convertase family protein
MNSYPQNIVRDRPKIVSQGGRASPRFLGLFLLLFSVAGLCLNTSAQWTANNDGKDRTITAESCLPPNGYIDPGETNTVSFVVKNTSGAERRNVKVTLLEQGNVRFPSGEVTIGTVANNATFNVSFTFRAEGACGANLTPTLRVTSDGVSAQSISFVPFQLGATVLAGTPFGPSAAVTINDYVGSDANKLGRATPYPSTISVSGLPKYDAAATARKVDKVSVTLHGITHGWSQDIEVLLRGPNDKAVVLMAKAGGNTGTTAPITDVTLTFEDSASGLLPQNAGQIASGTYKPSNYGADAFPGVSVTVEPTLAAAFNNISDPNGSWRLYVIDSTTGDAGIIAGGWSLNIRTTQVVCCGAGQTWPFITRIPEKTVLEDLGGGKDVEIASFTIFDLDDADANKLAVQVTSADQSKVTDSNLVVKGTGNNRTIEAKQLVANANGNVTITVMVTDPQGHASASSFNLKITPVNDAPTISGILGQKVNVGTQTGPIPFTVGDVETLAENLLVLVNSSDLEKVPVQNIVVSGTAANRTVNVIPASSTTSGEVTITLTVRDTGDGTNPPAETPRAFVVSFTAQTGYPTITPISAQAVDEDGNISIPFNIRSGLTGVSPDALVLSASSGNTTLLPTSGITFSGTGADRTVRLAPAANRNGQVSVTLTVANGALTDSTTFSLTVRPVNDAPTITSVSPQFTNEDTTSGDIVFTVGDIETGAANLVVTAESDNAAVVPNLINPDNLATLGGIQITANNAVRTLRVRPAPNAFGKANITVTVTDRGDPDNNFDNAREVARPKSSSTSFVLTVNAVNDAPGIVSVGNTAESLVNWTDSDPRISFAEDSGDTADATRRQRRIVLSGVTPGPVSSADVSEASQSVTVTAVSSKTAVLEIVKIDPATVNQPYPKNTTLHVRLGENQYTAANDPVEITLTLTDSGGTDLGGVNTTVRKFKVDVTPVNDTPTLAFPTLPAPLPGQDLSELNVPKNRSFTLPMSVGDVETPRTLMDMSYTVDDPGGKFPPGSILFDLGRTMVTFLPSAAQVTLPYTATVNVTAKDKGATNTEADDAAEAVRPKSVSRSFKVTIRDIEPPTISAAATDIIIDEDTVGQTTLTVTDNKAVSGLTFQVQSDNQVLVPNHGIMLGPLTDPSGLSAQRTLAIVPAADQYGIANVTVTVKDDETLESTVAIKLTVRPVNDPPRITLRAGIAPIINADGSTSPRTFTVLEDKTTRDEGTDSKLIEFDVADAPNETPADQLVISKDSSNKDLVPLDRILVGGTGTRRTLSITPAPNQNGTTTITLTVTDESGLSASGQFILAVTAVNDEPTIDQVSNMSIAENASEQTVNLTGITAGPDAVGPVEHRTIESVTVNVKNKGSDPAVNTLIAGTWPQSLSVTDGKASFKFTPVQFRHGTSTFTVTVRDAGGTANDGKNTKNMSFDVAITSVNQLPTITFQEGGNVTTIDRTIPPGGNTGVIPFYIADSPNETAPEFLQVSAVSSNPALIPNNPANLQLGGSHGTRGILIQPAAGQAGTAAITITVTDTDGGSRTGRINVTVQPGQNPTIGLNPTTATIRVNEDTDVIFITVSDAQTPAGQLLIGWQDTGLVTSDNPGLVPASAANIQFGGTGSNRAMIIRPVAGATGTANVRVYVKDGDANTSFATFTLNVLGSPPTITQILPQSQTVEVGKTTPAAAFQVEDKETFPGFLIVTAVSSDTTVIPNGNIFVLGGTKDRSITVLASDKAGTTIITVTVEDAEAQKASTQFSVTVVDNRPPPTLTSIADVTTTKNTLAGPITFVVGDAETPVAALQVEATCNNTTLVPNDRITLLQSSSNPASWTLLVNPAQDQIGSGTITVKVTNAANKSTTRSFLLTVIDRVVANDFNGDGRPDIILQHDAGWLGAWLMSGDDIASSTFLTPNNVRDLGWRVVSSGDFDGDNKPDLLFRHTDGTLAAWLMDGVTLKSSTFLNPSGKGSTAWNAITTADFNRDGKVDILFQHGDGDLAIWYMNGTELLSVGVVRPLRPQADWVAVGAADVNNDGHTDILFQHTDGRLAVWYLNGADLIMAAMINPASTGDADWRVVGISDLNQDGNADILFQNRATGAAAVWYMLGPNLISPSIINSGNGGWHIVAP